MAGREREGPHLAKAWKTPLGPQLGSCLSELSEMSYLLSSHPHVVSLKPVQTT